MSLMGKRIPSPKEALKILNDAGCPSNVIKHCMAVARLAVQIAEKCVENGVPVDIELVHVGALLHDIGRSKTHEVHHAVVGAEIARSLGLSESIIKIIERHVGGGISPEEAVKLGWPNRNYIPESIEEKIVSYADKLIEGEKVVSINKTIERFKGELGSNHPAIERIKRIHKEISSLCKSQNILGTTVVF